MAKPLADANKGTGFTWNYWVINPIGKVSIEVFKSQKELNVGDSAEAMGWHNAQIGDILFPKEGTCPIVILKKG